MAWVEPAADPYMPWPWIPRGRARVRWAFALLILAALVAGWCARPSAPPPSPVSRAARAAPVTPTRLIPTPSPQPRPAEAEPPAPASPLPEEVRLR